MSEPAKDDPAESRLEWKDGMLVYTGEAPPNVNIRELIELDREQRILHVLGLPDRPDALQDSRAGE